MKKSLISLMMLLIASFSYADDNMPSLTVGAAAPDFSASDTLGVEHRLNDYRGSYVVVDFWASWCGDCRREIPGMKTLYNDLQGETIDGKSIQWLSVSFDHDGKAWRNALRTYDFPWTQVSNLKKWKGNPIAKRWDLHWIPTLFVIDPQGRIAAAATTAEGLRAELYRLTGRKSLPAASRQRGEDIMTVLRQRHSERTFEERPVSEQDLADILWAACGVNRPNGNLTAPTAMNRQEIRLYAFTAEGTYLYEPRLHTLKTVANGDNRQLVVSRQENFNGTPLFLVIVADMDKFGRNGSHAQLMTAVDVGNVSQNINIFCSAAGLKNCPRATMDNKALQSLLGLGENQIPLMNNAVGY